MITHLDFPDIKPGETDDRTIDFTGRAGGQDIANANWAIAVSLDSQQNDPSAADRLDGDPTNAAAVTTHRFANMVNGVIYEVTVFATLKDGRVLSEYRYFSCNAEPLPVAVPSDVLTPERLKKDFPIFDNPAAFPTESIQFWIDQAVLLLRPERWRSVYLLGQELWVGHQLILDRYYAQAAGAVPGQGVGGGYGSYGSIPLMIGPAQSKSVNGVSVSYGFGMALETYGNPGYYNLTIFGQRWWRLAMMAGMGPIQIPGCGWNPSGTVVM